MKFSTTFILLFLSAITIIKAQKIEGFVFDQSNTPLIGANIYLIGSYDGTTSDTNGYFLLPVSNYDSAILVVSFIGFDTKETLIKHGLNEKLSIFLEHSPDMLDEIVVMAGSFEAGDKKRGVILSAIDVATTASSEGDIYGALATFPGTTKQGESGKIIVRGGEAHETKTYIDGMLVSSPYSTSYPDLPSRGRFTPFMFNGIMFSTGGYSAEYGQALSSVLELKTPGLFDETLTSIYLMNVGVGASHTKRNTKSAYSIDANYNNLRPYFLLAKHELNWLKTPVSLSSNFKYRYKIGKTGLLKSNIGYSYSKSSLLHPSINNGADSIVLTNKNLFIKTVYSTEIKNNWLFKTGIAYNSNLDKTDINKNQLIEKLSSLHARIGFSNYLGDNLTIKYGTEYSGLYYNFNYADNSLPVTYKLGAKDNIASAYLEGDFIVNKNFVFRLGTRAEHSYLSKNSNIAPRFSAAYKTGKYSQVSVAYGVFYQQAQTNYLKYNKNLNFESAEHYILNYQTINNGRVFRTEFYRKNYLNLTTYEIGELLEYTNIANRGTGYAQGIDIFWSDKTSLRNIDYRLSYSFIDSKRKYHNYPEAATPGFISKHNFSAVYKQWIAKLNSQIGLTYSFASGRSYNNPNSNSFMSNRTSSIHDLSGNLSYITNIFGQFTVIHLAVSNILGLEKVYSYRFSLTENNSGYISSPVKSMINRTIILGAFITLK